MENNEYYQLNNHTVNDMEKDNALSEFPIPSKEEFISRFERLGTRTMSVLWLFINRNDDSKIAENLNINKETVRYHLRKASINIGVNNPNSKRNNNLRSDLTYVCMIYYSDMEKCAEGIL